MPLPLKDTKDLLYIKTRALVIASPCGHYNKESGDFAEYEMCDCDRVKCPYCDYEIFNYDCKISKDLVICSSDLHMLRYHRELIVVELLGKLKQITGVVD